MSARYRTWKDLVDGHAARTAGKLGDVAEDRWWAQSITGGGKGQADAVGSARKLQGEGTMAEAIQDVSD